MKLKLGILLKRFAQKRVKQALFKSFIIFLEISLFFTSYSGLFIGLGGKNQVKAYDTAGWPHCEDIWPNFPNGTECYMRGTFQPYVVASNTCIPVNGGWTTNRIVYPSGHQYNYCVSNPGPLNNQEVIVFVRWTGAGTYIILQQAILATSLNQAPNQPGINRPQSGWELGPLNNGAYPNANCDSTGTGQGCSVEFSTSSFDPDFFQAINLEAQVTRNEGGNNNYTQNLTSNNATHNRSIHLTDGHWNFSARNCDTLTCSGYTSSRSFIVDTTAPTGVNMLAEPEYSPGLQNTVSASAGSDNLAGGIQYLFEIDSDPSFATPENSSGWINSTIFNFANLLDDTKYYYRVKAKDRLDNISDWSSVTTNSTQDATAPVIQDIGVDNARISSKNLDNQFDSTTINFNWLEKYSANAQLEVLDASNNVIRTITKPLLVGTTTLIAETFNWDGKDTGGNFVIDGPYILKLSVSDKAGNVTSDESTIVIVDNLPADLNVSTPSNGSWFNYQNI
ncbi:MAG: FlgD immunoglobulin-like domain containing protein [bacterium]